MLNMAEEKDSSTNSLEVCPTARQHALVFVGESSLSRNFSVQDKMQQSPDFVARTSITLIVFSGHAFVISQSNGPERKEKEMKAVHMNQMELAARWRISPRTLERWRWIGDGPRFVKLGGRVIYRLCDIEAYENECLVSSTAEFRKHTKLSDEAVAAGRC